jgi:hypothetical protein
MIMMNGGYSVTQSLMQSFDLHNNGHVTQEQFLRTLNIAGLPLAVNEVPISLG